MPFASQSVSKKRKAELLVALVAVLAANLENRPRWHGKKAQGLKGVRGLAEREVEGGSEVPFLRIVGDSQR